MKKTEEYNVMDPSIQANKELMTMLSSRQVVN